MGDERALRVLIGLQGGVIARTQVLECGFGSAYVRQQLRCRAWVAVYPGVYATHTGALSWHQRVWAAILDACPAAASHDSALSAAGVGREPRRDDPIHIAVEAGRKVTRRPGVIVHHRSLFNQDVLDHTTPPRVRLEEALIDVASETLNEMKTIATLSDAVGSRRTTPDRLLSAVVRRTRLRHRMLIEGLLADLRDGACSALEHSYLTRVERPHGLPSPVRQAPTGAGRPGFRDLDYPDWGLVIELDGRAHHDNARDRDRDLERDLDAAVVLDRHTIRLGWGQAHVRSCSTAVKVGRYLSLLGWPDSPHPCTSPNCVV